ncbi:MAG: hypothetical protein ACR2FG_07380 [Marmoricola sp.]
MISTVPEQRAHPILGFARALDGALDRVSSVDPVFMTADDKRSALLALTREQHRLDALRLRVLCAADLDDVGALDGSTSTTSGSLPHPDRTGQELTPSIDGHRASPAGA